MQPSGLQSIFLFADNVTEAAMKARYVGFGITINGLLAKKTIQHETKPQLKLHPLESLENHNNAKTVGIVLDIRESFVFATTADGQHLTLLEKVLHVMWNNLVDETILFKMSNQRNLP